MRSLQAVAGPWNDKHLGEELSFHSDASALAQRATDLTELVGSISSSGRQEPTLSIFANSLAASYEPFISAQLARKVFFEKREEDNQEL